MNASVEPDADTAFAGSARLGLVVEDQPDTRVWLANLLRQAFAGMEVSAVDTVQAGSEWIASRLTPGAPSAAAGQSIALIDLGLPDGSGVALVRELAEHHPGVLPVVATIFDDDAHLFEAIAAGAQGYLLKDREPGALIDYLRRIETGHPPLSPSIARRIVAHFRRRPGLLPQVHAMPEAALTPRETEVLGLLGRGLRVGEAARLLGLSDHTVAGYVKEIYRKLNVSSRAEAAVEAARRGLV